MKKGIKRQWLEALRSEQYPQVRKFLRKEEGYCALGVLCDLHIKETGSAWSETFYQGRAIYHYHYSNGELPTEVRKWAGLKFADATVVTQYNDTGSPFPVIAEWIERNL